MKTRRYWAVCILLLASPLCLAADEEIQVYEDDLSAPGQFGVDVHNNYVLSGSHTPGYAGEQAPMHVYRLTPEFHYGLTKSVELGLYLLSTRGPEGAAHFNGPKMRIKYVPVHDVDKAFTGARTWRSARPRGACPCNRGTGR